MSISFEGKVAIVTGAGNGLGRSHALALAERGAKVVVNDLGGARDGTGASSDAAMEVVGIIEAAGGEAFAHGANVSNFDEVENMVAQAMAKWGRVDILINNTGGPPPTSAANQSIELWQSNFNHLVLLLMKVTDRVLPQMKAKAWGRIITSTSSGMISPIPGLAISNTLRAAIMGWSKTLASEVAKDGVTVNIVLPGRIATDRLHELDQIRAQKESKTVAEISARLLAAIPIGRYGDPQEYAAAVTFLASQQASYITGATLRIDGGSYAGH